VKKDEVIKSQETFEHTLEDGTVLTLRRLKMKDILNAKSSNATLRGMELVALAVTKVNGEEKKLSALNDIVEWSLSDFNEVSKALSEFSGINIDESDAKNF